MSRFSVKPRSSLLLAALTVLATLSLVTSAGQAAAAPKPYRGGTIVTLGDSRASGAFAASPLNAKLGCSRSADNFTTHAAANLGRRNVVNLACSRAVSANIWRDIQWTDRLPHPPQLSLLPPDTRLITVATGHNDLQWSVLRLRCYTEGNSKDRGCRTEPTTRRHADQRLAVTRREVNLALRQIRRAAPRAQIVVLGPGGLIGDTGCSRQLPMSTADAVWLRGVFDRANAFTRRAADAIGASYVDIQREAVGHGVCAGKRAWFAGKKPGPGVAPFHMNRTGSRAIGRLIAAQVDR